MPENAGQGPQWLRWAREIQALAQTGLTFSENEYEKERNTRLMEIASEIVSEHTALDRAEVLETMIAQPGYATPKVDVRGAAIREGRILLVKEAADGKWCMPGGWADVGDHPAEAIVREVKEESGFDVEVRKVIGVFDANRDGRPMEFYHAFKVVFLVEIVGGAARTSHETLAVDFFDPESPPPLSMNRTHPRHLEEIGRHLSDPGRKTWFE